MDLDYIRNDLPDNGTAIPGPYQNLQKGQNNLTLWNGLRPLAEYELPYSFSTAVSYQPQKDNSLIKIYPNPTKGQLYLQMRSNHFINELQIGIYNLTGKLVYKQNLTGLDCSEINKMIFLSDIETGMYLMQVYNENIKDNMKLVLQGK